MLATSYVVPAGIATFVFPYTRRMPSPKAEICLAVAPKFFRYDPDALIVMPAGVKPSSCSVPGASS